MSLIGISFEEPLEFWIVIQLGMVAWTRDLKEDEDRMGRKQMVEMRIRTQLDNS